MVWYVKQTATDKEQNENIADSFALLVSNEPIHNSKSLINKHCLIMKTFVISSSYKYVYKRPGKELLRLFTT